MAVQRNFVVYLTVVDNEEPKSNNHDAAVGFKEFISHAITEIALDVKHIEVFCDSEQVPDEESVSNKENLKEFGES